MQIIEVWGNRKFQRIFYLVLFSDVDHIRMVHLEKEYRAVKEDAERYDSIHEVFYVEIAVFS